MLAGTAAVLVILTAATGCGNPTLVRLEQQAELPGYLDATSTIPAQAENTMRLYIYRPQSMVGMWGSAIVIVNGAWLGDRNNPVIENKLIPGAVFVVDVPAAPARVWSYQSGRGEDLDSALELSPAQSRTWFLRWTLKPTYGYLRAVDEREALAELESLRFSGYVTLDSPQPQRNP
jgi:hypothetical protein